jgi:hypothetical protein
MQILARSGNSFQHHALRVKFSGITSGSILQLASVQTLMTKFAT